VWRALWQIVNTIIPLGVLWYLMYLCLAVSGGWWCRWQFWPGRCWCACSSFFMIADTVRFSKSRGANDAVGFLAGILTFTPYYHWRWEHAIHHSNAGDLDKRGTGDVWTMTVQEYLESSRWKKFAYRLARNLHFICHRAAVPVRDSQRFPSPKQASANVIPSMR